MGQRSRQPASRTKLSDVTVDMILNEPVEAIDATIFTYAKAVENASDALGSLPSLARSLEQLRPGSVLLEEVVRLKRSLERLDRVGAFVADELPETQQQLEALTGQLNDSVNKIGDVGRAIMTHTAVNSTLNDSIKLMTKGLGVAQGTAESVGRAIGKVRGRADETAA